MMPLRCEWPGSDGGSTPAPRAALEREGSTLQQPHGVDRGGDRLAHVDDATPPGAGPASNTSNMRRRSSRLVAGSVTSSVRGATAEHHVDLAVLPRSGRRLLFPAASTNANSISPDVARRAAPVGIGHEEHVLAVRLGHHERPAGHDLRRAPVVTMALDDVPRPGPRPMWESRYRNALRGCSRITSSVRSSWAITSLTSSSMNAVGSSSSRIRVPAVDEVVGGERLAVAPPQAVVQLEQVARARRPRRACSRPATAPRSCRASSASRPRKSRSVIVCASST